MSSPEPWEMPDAPPRTVYKLKTTAEFERLNGNTEGAGETGEHAGPIDVREILKANVVADVQCQQPIEAPSRWRLSHRTRDYLLAMAIGNGFLLSLLAVLHRNPFTLAFGIAGMAIYTAGLTWTMFVVMDRY